MQRSLPLEGIRVIDYTHYLAGPYAARCLADLGAEVIKVEPIKGDPARGLPYDINGESGFFLQQNSGKKGIAVNVKHPAGLKLMQELIRTADVFLENYRPGALSRVGLGYEDLIELNDRIVYCSLSAYGQYGSKSSQAGFGLVAEAMSGAMSLIGNPGEPPPVFRIPIADILTGTHGVAAICASLFGRTQERKPVRLDLSLYDCMVALHDHALQAYLLSSGECNPYPAGRTVPGLTIYGTFAASDGCLVIAAQTDELWAKLAQLIGGEELASDSRFAQHSARNANSEEAIAIVDKWISSHTSVADCLAALKAADIPCSPVQTIAQVASDNHLMDRGMFERQNHPKLGDVTLPSTPFAPSFYKSEMRPAPTLGQNSEEIALSLGFSYNQVESMRKEGAIC